MTGKTIWVELFIWTTFAKQGMPHGLLHQANDRLPSPFTKSSSDVFALVKAFVSDRRLSQPPLLAFPGCKPELVKAAFTSLGSGRASCHLDLDMIAKIWCMSYILCVCSYCSLCQWLSPLKIIELHDSISWWGEEKQMQTEPEAPHAAWPMRPKWTSGDWRITSRSIMERMVKEFAICANSLEYLPCPKAFFQKFRYLALKPTCEVEKKWW